MNDANPDIFHFQVIDKSLYVAEFQQEEPANGEENWTTLSLLTRSFNSTNLLIQEKKNLHATDRYIKILFYNYKKNNMKREHAKCFHLLCPIKGGIPDAP